MSLCEYVGGWDRGKVCIHVSLCVDKGGSRNCVHECGSIDCVKST